MRGSLWDVIVTWHLNALLRTGAPMLAIRSAFVFGALAFVPPATTPPPPPRHVAENIVVGDFAANLTYNLSSIPVVRRGVTSSVSIRKNLIDLVPFGMVSVSGQGATISNLQNGTTGGTGFLAMNLSVPSSASLGGTIALRVGATDIFQFRVVARGLVSSITKAPDPSTIAAGTQWIATVNGTDLGTPIIDAGVLQCHTVSSNNRTNSSVDLPLQRTNANCNTTTFSFRLKNGSANDPPSWALSNGNTTNFSFTYQPPPPSGVTCTSAPNIGTPVITGPANQQVLVFGRGTVSPTPATITWNLNTAPNNVPAPNNEWIVSRSGTGLKGTATTTVTGTSKSFNFTIPGTYTVTIRAANCGQSAPPSSVTFSTRYQ
jgi:hypothetical protein